MAVNFLSEEQRRREEAEQRKLSERKFERPMTIPHEMVEPTEDTNKVISSASTDKTPVDTSPAVASLRQTSTMHEPAKNSDNNAEESFWSGLVRKIKPLSSIVIPKKLLTDNKKEETSIAMPEVKRSEPHTIVPVAHPPSPQVQDHHKKTKTRWPLPLASIEVATFFAILLVVFISGLATGLVLLVATPQPTPPPVVVTKSDEHKLAELRDSLRLADLALLRESLDEYWRGSAAHYPNGNNVELGTLEASCLGATGWTTHDRCVIPLSPAENRIYLGTIPLDQSGSSYRYTSLEGGRAYQIDFMLEVGIDKYPAGENTITGGAVSQPSTPQS
ncbi:hypothetical protein COV04_00070 [Candidatus Uhrbacteria bacterium CG10_big_fil_rev_8_21_14_0_10_48_11]|uniref:Type II secretion system protein GspG C-terminal domain-containing protein n=1 Tax=Candidatus Uhrbacteria bacterium CG10_big_fil_rev_8_21_14_0_10_48_11 TaxID=1975037 RepID=A0A2M8LFP7_9BACT|nr:MAG: hypothetical protein COV04_00070 [Candidatus Uhrbacteria bacterium CG10_big_fil_rev_8_21_14_0_10_48_11]